MTLLSLDMTYRSFREVLAGSTPASIRRLHSAVAGATPAAALADDPSRTAPAGRDAAASVGGAAPRTLREYFALILWNVPMTPRLKIDQNPSIAALGASNYTYAEATWTLTLPRFGRRRITRLIE
jgi:hypothetical protein